VRPHSIPPYAAVQPIAMLPLTTCTGIQTLGNHPARQGMIDKKNSTAKSANTSAYGNSRRQPPNNAAIAMLAPIIGALALAAASP